MQIHKNTVTKVTTPDLMRIEVEKTIRAYEIGKKCGLFSVPKVLEYDEPTGKVVLEHLDVKPVLLAVTWADNRSALAKTLGASLAIIHRELILPESMLVHLPAEFASPHDEVFLHGDVSVRNVCVGNSWPPIVILDWQMTPKYGSRATYGTRYFDILWFISNLISHPYPRFIVSNPVTPVVRIFIESYFQEAQLPYYSERFYMYAKRFFGVVAPRIKQNIYQNSKGRARLLWPF